MTFNKTKLALAVAAASLAMAAVSPQVMAHPGKGAHKKAKSSGAVAKVDRVQELEAQMNQMASSMQAMQSELARVKAGAGTAGSAATSAKVQELDQWMASVKAAPAEKKSKDNVVSVRGGWLGADNRRGGANGSITNGAAVVPASGDILVGGAGGESDSDAVYYGAAFDFNVNNNLFGLMDNTSFQIEFGAEYAEFSDTTNSVLTGQQVTVNQLRVNASPKIKFMHDSKLRPWIIPVGLDINIISPPSGAVTVMNTGMNFGAGAEYDLFGGIVLGGDVRYHYSMDDIDGVETDGLSAGGSVGFKF